MVLVSCLFGQCFGDWIWLSFVTVDEVFVFTSLTPFSVLWHSSQSLFLVLLFNFYFYYMDPFAWRYFIRLPLTVGKS